MYFIMKNSIPRYTFHKNKYGSELLIDVVELKYVKKFLAESSVHTLTYYDITFITEGEGSFSIDNRTYEAFPQDVFFSKAGEIRNWDTRHITNGYALIFEDEFLSSLLRDSMFVRHLAFSNRKRHQPNCIFRTNFIHVSFKYYTISKRRLTLTNRMIMTCMF